jgi:2'-5' RNA ligase
MTERQNLYFIAIIPPQGVCNEITAFKNDFANRFNSVKALKVVPHITLKAPFKLPTVEHAALLDWFQKLYINLYPFAIELKDFGAFHNSRSPVVFVNPIMNASLYSLQGEVLKSFIAAYPDVPIPFPELKFFPHITIAYRDLQPQMFKKAWEEYSEKKFEATFEVVNFHLLQHDGKKWNIISTYPLPSNVA